MMYEATREEEVIEISDSPLMCDEAVDLLEKQCVNAEVLNHRIFVSFMTWYCRFLQRLDLHNVLRSGNL